MQIAFKKFNYIRHECIKIDVPAQIDKLRPSVAVVATPRRRLLLVSNHLVKSVMVLAVVKMVVMEMAVVKMVVMKMVVMERRERREIGLLC